MSDLPPYPGPENYRLLAEMNRIAASKARDPAKKAALERLAKEHEERAEQAAEAIRVWRSFQ